MNATLSPFSLSLCLSLFLSLPLPLTSEQGAHTLFNGQKERERGAKFVHGERDREREKEGERESKQPWGERENNMIIKFT